MENLNLAKIRVRIAPSPTGFVHIGNLRTILYNYLFARHSGGKFIVRIEDTDRTRFVQGAMEDLLKTLEWAGLDYDEGPKLKNKKIVQVGEYAPYLQSLRLKIYDKHIKDLIAKNKAYYCFCSKDRLEELRKNQEAHKLPPKYDQKCRDLSKKEVQEKIINGEPYVIRFRMPENKEVVFDDAIRGTIVVNTNDLDDFVLIKADGFPTYHFANIVDDHLMKITHVLRGDEWIASTPKHVLLYESFGWHSPIFAHLPALLNKSKKKLSKRDGASSVKDFIAQGYLKEALLNFIALLGWNSGTEQEIHSMDELIKQFSLDNVHKSGAVFDIDKLDWINGMYIRNLSLDDFFAVSLPFLVDAGVIEEKNDKIFSKFTNEEISTQKLKKICALEQTRIKKLTDLPVQIENFMKDKIDYSSEVLVWKKSTTAKTKEVLDKLRAELEKIEANDFILETIEKRVKNFIEAQSLGNGDVLWPFRVALSGKDKSPGPYEMADALGSEMTLDRLNTAISKL